MGAGDIFGAGQFESRIEPESRHRCSLLQPIAAPRRALSVTSRYFWGFFRLPKLRVAGSYQFNELASGWYPQLVMLNEAGAVQRSGVALRARMESRPDERIGGSNGASRPDPP